MQAQIEEQKAQSEALKQQLVRQENASESEIAAYKREQEELRAASFATLQTAAASVQPQASKVTTQLSSTPAAAPVSGNLGTVISAGYKYIGNSTYKFGGGRTSYDISRGYFDCSGFVSWAFRQGGISVGASTDVLKNTGTRVSFSQIQPGDMVFFNTYKTDGHVGIYIGGGKFIGSQSSTGVGIASMTSGYWANTFNGRVMRVAN
jgi:cell wall-associated NlpC family hydrolase